MGPTPQLQRVLDNPVEWSQIRCVPRTWPPWVCGSSSWLTNTFNVLYVARGKYLFSTVNPIVAKQIHTMSKLCHWTERIFISQFTYFKQPESEFTQLHFAKIVVQIWSFSYEIVIEENKSWCFSNEHLYNRPILGTALLNVEQRR